MSKSNSDLGGVLVGIAALITAIIGVFNYLQTKPDSSRPSPLYTSVPQASASPSPKLTPDKISETGGLMNIELAKIYADKGKNSVQAEDIYKGKLANVSGFLRQDSIYECSFQNDQQIKEETRCMRFSANDGKSAILYGLNPDYYYYVDLRFNPNDISQAKEINRWLYNGKPLSMIIQCTISFDNTGSIVLENWKIIDYKPI